MAASSTDDLIKTALAQIDYYLTNGAWTEPVSDRGVEFKTCPHRSHEINVFLGTKTLACSLDKLIAEFWDNVSESGVKAFDPDCLTWQCQQLSPTERCVYQVNKLTWPIWNRSFCTLFFKYERGEQTIIGYTAMEHPDFPEKPKDDVRGKVSFTGNILTPVDGKVKIQRIMHIDPAGSIPTALINRLGGRQIVDYLLHIESKCT